MGDQVTSLPFTLRLSKAGAEEAAAMDLDNATSTIEKEAKEVKSKKDKERKKEGKRKEKRNQKRT